MKIAIPAVAGKLCSHFENFDKFIIITVKNHQIKNKEEYTPPSHDEEKLLGWLKGLGISLIILDKIGDHNQQILNGSNIKIIIGAPPADPLLLVNFYMSKT